MKIFALLAASIAAHAKSTFGVVLGHVKDASGAIVLDATVNLTNTAENVSRTGPLSLRLEF